jgi:hypothetical protein
LTGSAARARAYRLFSQALEYAGELREQFLVRECRGDLVLRAEIDALLRLALHDETATRAFLALPQFQARHASIARDEARTVTAFLTDDILAAANPIIAGTRDVQLRPLLDGAAKTL